MSLILQVMDKLTLLQSAERYVADWYLEHANSKLSFHNMALAKRLVHRIEELGVGQSLPASVIQDAQVAALFSQVGYAINYDQPIDASWNKLQAFLSTMDLSNDEKMQIAHCLVPKQSTVSPVADLFQDAWVSHVLGDGLDTYLPLYRMEVQLMRKETMNKATARAWFYTQIKEANLKASFAKAKYASILTENKANLELQVSKKKARGEQEAQLFGGIARAQPSREIQTFFRTSFEYHTKLIGISDNKARIMISVNSILVSVFISLLTYNYQKVATSLTPMVIVPIIIFLIAAVGSLIFAILSSRPNLPYGATQPNEQLFSFMDFTKLDKDEYQKQMDMMLQDGASIFRSMTSALYYLGKILDRKYKYLTISYNIFMVGFVVSVVMFMVTYFL